MSIVNDQLKHELYLNRLATDLLNKKIYPSFNEAYLAVRAILNDAEEIKSIGQLNRITRAINELLQEQLSNGWQGATDELAELAVYESEYYAKLIGVPNIPPATTVQDFVAAALLSLGEGERVKVGAWADFVRQNVDGMTEQYNNIIKAGYINGATIGQIKKTLKSYNEGLARQHVEALARTGALHYANSARRAMADANKDVIDREYPLVMFDNRRSLKCSSIYMMYKDGWPLNESPVGYPPYHFNAVGKGELITTAAGQKKIENVVAGEYVLTHKGRFKKVLATMSKRNETDFIRVIRLKSGRVIRVTDEHPVLLDDIGWVRADQIKVGDNLFEHSKQNAKALSGLPVVVRNSYDYPSAFDGSEVFSQIAISSIVMPFAVNFYPDLVTADGKVKYAIGETVLVSEALKSYCVENGNEVCFSLPHCLSLPCDLSIHEGAVACSSAQGVCFGHSFGVSGMNRAGFLCHPESPVVLSNPNASFNSIQSCNATAFGSCHRFDSVNSKPSTHCSISKIKLSLYHSESFSSFEMVSVDEAGEVGFISKFEHSLIPSIVESISIVEYKEDVYNLEVEDDHSYLVDGVVTHNCRTTIIYGTKGQGDPRGNMPAIGAGADYPDDADKKPVYKGRKDLGKFKIESVKYGTNLDIWMKDQGFAFVADNLGEARAKLLFDGKLSLARMTDAFGNPLTLEQLRQRDAAAFRRAGLL